MWRRDLSVAGRIAWRYFFSAKSTHAVNIIAIVAVAGIALVTTAMVVVLSVFNGFEDFTNTQLSALSPDYKLERVDGQTFSPAQYHLTEGAGVLETQAVAKYEEYSQPIRLIGLDASFQDMLPIDSYMFGGDFDTGTADVPTAVMGIGVAMQLGAGAGYAEPVEIFLPKRVGRISNINPAKGFQRGRYHVVGVFNVDQEEDNDVVYLNIDEVRRLLQYDADEVSYLALEHPIEPPTGFVCLDRYRQHPEIYKMLRMEKWVSFVLLLFVLLLSLFSVISTLGMLILEKKADAETLSFLGARQRLVNLIPLLEGWLLSLTGLVIGLIVGSVLVLLQGKYGFVKLAAGDTSAFLLDAYPVRYHVPNILLISAIIVIVGAVSSLLAFYIFRWNKRA